MERILHSTVLLLFLWTYSALLILLTDTKEFCHNEDFMAECPYPGELILMESASYGRMKVGRCVKMDFGFVGCSVDVLNHTHERCSGRKSCLIRVPDSKLDSTGPCNDDLKSYLEANYTCITVSSPDSTPCKLTLDADNSTGYIASLGRPGTTPPPARSPRRCGTRSDPWIISVPTGQRLNITLMDFTSSTDPQVITGSTVSNPSAPSTTTASADSCRLYAIVEEKTGSDVQICGSGVVETTHVFASGGDTVKVIVFGRKEEDATRFLLKFEATGCPDILPNPPNVWLRREADLMKAGCVTSEVTWQLVCVGTRWEGTAVNCSIVSSRDARREEGSSSLTLGASILIIVGVSFAIGLVVLLFGVYYMKRRRDGLPIGVRGHQLRDLKPLSSDTAYEAASVYARNTAFEPVRVATHSRGGRGVTIDDCSGGGNEYEYVWDVPSNMVPIAGTGTGRTLPTERDFDETRSRAPDLIKSGGRTVQPVKGTTHCSCLAPEEPPVKPRSSTLAKTGSEGSRSTSTRFASLECRASRSTGREMGRGTGFRKDGRGTGGGGGTWDSDTVKVCRHCGHSVPDSSGEGQATQRSVTMPRRQFQATETGRSGHQHHSQPPSLTPTTMTRSQRH